MSSQMNIQDPAVRSKVRSAMGEISASMTRMEAERDLIKEIIKKLAEDHELPKKALSKMGKIFHKESFSKEQEEQDEFFTLYETVIGSPV